MYVCRCIISAPFTPEVCVHSLSPSVHFVHSSVHSVVHVRVSGFPLVLSQSPGEYITSSFYDNLLEIVSHKVHGYHRCISPCICPLFVMWSIISHDEKAGRKEVSFLLLLSVKWDVVTQRFFLSTNDYDAYCYSIQRVAFLLELEGEKDGHHQGENMWWQRWRPR